MAVQRNYQISKFVIYRNSVLKISSYGITIGIRIYLRQIKSVPYQIYQISPNKKQALIGIQKMDVQTRQPQLIIKPNSSQQISLSELPTIPRAHIIPATTKQSIYDAQVSNYFTTTIKPLPSNDNNCLEATLLGHELEGKVYKTDQLFDAFLMRENDQVTLTVLRKVGEVVDWRKDRLWGDTDGPYLGIQKCIQVQKVLHDF